MNIMFEDSINDKVREKYTLLELDTFRFADSNTTSIAYCLVENTPITEMFTIEQFLELHKNLMKNYRLQNWKFCEDALEHLTGKWNGELDTFYNEVNRRIQLYKVNDPGPEWDGVIQHAPADAISDTTKLDR
jgi:hypothetical protein